MKEGATATETHYRIDHQRAYSEIVIESTKVNNGAWVDTVHVHTPDGVGELIASSASGSTTQYFADGLGSVRVAQEAAQRLPPCVASASSSYFKSASGSASTKHAPGWPSGRSAQCALPPWRWAMVRTRARPRPTPPSRSLAPGRR